jgi:hypothetical protein
MRVCCQDVMTYLPRACRDDANKAIEKLNGFGYDNLILRVEHAAPRADRPA